MYVYACVSVCLCVCATALLQRSQPYALFVFGFVLVVGFVCIAGKSTQGREIFALQISDSPTEIEAGEPFMYYAANIHGNEVGWVPLNTTKRTNNSHGEHSWRFK